MKPHRGRHITGALWLAVMVAVGAGGCVGELGGAEASDSALADGEQKKAGDEAKKAEDKKAEEPKVPRLKKYYAFYSQGGGSSLLGHLTVEQSPDGKEIKFTLKPVRFVLPSGFGFEPVIPDEVMAKVDPVSFVVPIKQQTGEWTNLESDWIVILIGFVLPKETARVAELPTDAAKAVANGTLKKEKVFATLKDPRGGYTYLHSAVRLGGWVNVWTKDGEVLTGQSHFNLDVQLFDAPFWVKLALATLNAAERKDVLHTWVTQSFKAIPIANPTPADALAKLPELMK
jgi:hypothetical protein